MTAQVCEENELSHTSKLITFPHNRDCGPLQDITEDDKLTWSNGQAVFSPISTESINKPSIHHPKALVSQVSVKYKHYLHSALTWQTNYNNTDHNKCTKHATSCTWYLQSTGNTQNHLLWAIENQHKDKTHHLIKKSWISEHVLVRQYLICRLSVLT